jgi:acyl-CoA synthetase (AMP-forming)/AMP-acid ligase II
MSAFRDGKHFARFLGDIPKLLPRAHVSPGQLVEKRARRGPADLALAYRDERFSWAQVDERASRYAGWFRSLGIGRGDVVALVMNNRPDYLFIIMGLSKLGAIGALINTNLTGKALTHALSVAKPKHVIAGSEHAARVSELLEQLDGIDPQRDFFVHVEPDASPDAGMPGTVLNDAVAAQPAVRADATVRGHETFCFIYTSGTTGLPKAAIVTNQRYLGGAIAFGRLMHRSGPGDVIYAPLPLYHANALMLGWGSALITGAGFAARRKFSTSGFWTDVREFQATSFVYIGELCRYLLNAPAHPDERAHRLRVAVGNGLRADIWAPFQQRFAVPVIREFYGSTEGNAPALNLSGKPGMIGRLGAGQAVVRCDPATGDLIRNADGLCERVAPGQVGLLVGRISSLMGFDGYVDRKASDSKVLRDVFRTGDRYFNTGDLIHLHPARWMSFADRLGDTFRWKGENVSTSEVGEILCGAPGVLEANVYGVEVPGADGRAGMAALKTAPDFAVDQLASYVQDHLAAYQRPVFVRVLQGEMRIVGTLKQQKVDYRKEGYDPSLVTDPLYVLDGTRYTALDGARYDQVQRGDTKRSA